MKKEILNRIKALGGNIDHVKGTSLKEDIMAITFNTVLYARPEDTPWAEAEEAEPIYGIGEYVDNHREQFEQDKNTFYQQMLDHYYCLTDEGRGQTFFTNELFTPFTKGTPSYEEWNGEWEEEDWKKVIKGEKMELIQIAYDYGFPDHLYVCLTDPNPENPIVYGTDHEEFFDEISIEGTLEEYFNRFMTKEELLSIVKNKLEH